MVAASSATDLRSLGAVLSSAATSDTGAEFRFLNHGYRPDDVARFADVHGRARAVAASLGEVETGSRVILLYPAGLEFVKAFFGCLYAGLVAVPLPPPWEGNRAQRLARIRSVVADSGARIVLCQDSVREDLAATFGDADGFPGVAVLATDRVPDSLAGDWQGRRIDLDWPAYFQYSSGSTGDPKAVVLTHEVVLNNLRYLSHVLALGSEIRTVSWLPMFHDFGLVGSVLLPAYVRSSAYLMAPMAFVKSPLRWLRAVSDHRAGMILSPNFGYQLCVERIKPADLDGVDLSTLIRALVGAEPIRSATLDAFTSAFAPYGFRRRAFVPGYGLAEATLMVTAGKIGAEPIVRTADARALAEGRFRPVDGRQATGRDIVSCGPAPKGIDVVIVEPGTSKPDGPDVVGEIMVASSSLGLGYWGRPAITEAVFDARVDGWPDRRFLRTGDLGFLSDGQLYVTGRVKDLIIASGQNHYPSDIETSVEASHRAVRSDRSVAFSLDDGVAERLVIVAEVRPDRQRWLDASDEHRAEVVTAVREAVARHGLQADDVVLVRPGRVPMTSSGKKRRGQCRDDYLADRLAS